MTVGMAVPTTVFSSAAIKIAMATPMSVTSVRKLVIDVG
jgi:hypothetical protein